MLAFGVPVRRLLAVEVIESVILGLLGTFIGVVIGFAAVAWVVGAKVLRRMDLPGTLRLVE